MQRGRIPLWQQLGGMGERCKIPHRSLGRSPEINDYFFYPHVCTCTCMYRLWTVLYQCASCTERVSTTALYTKLKGVPKKTGGGGSCLYGPAIGAKLLN